MTAKEKAEEIYYMFDANETYALNCVNEIINCDSFFKTLESVREFTAYWYEVQEEIKLL